MILPFIRIWRQVAATPSQRETERLFNASGKPSCIMQGPFKDMVYMPHALGAERSLLYVLGTYEIELWPWIERLIVWEPDTLIDVGSAEGYYAVGFANRLRGSRVVAFELDRFYRYLTWRTARLNGCVDRVQFRKFCDPKSLRDVLAESKRPAVFCDCEGYEVTLLNPDEVPGLRIAAILVELHEGKVPLLVEILQNRFGATHELDIVAMGKRSLEDLPSGVRMSPAEADRAMSDRRIDSGRWMLLTPKCSPC